MNFDDTVPPDELAVSTAAPDLRYRLDPGLIAADGGPVYRREPGRAVVVPTGLVLVRLHEGDRIDELHADIESAGYTVDSVLSYAGHAAWVKASSGRTTDALLHLDRLAGLAGVEHVEPQMIGVAARRR